MSPNFLFISTISFIILASHFLPIVLLLKSILVFQFSLIITIRVCILILNQACSLHSNSPRYVVFELVANMHCNGLKIQIFMHIIL